MKDKNNKEHPIDNLFAHKLGHLEGTPSGDVWQTLEKGISQKRKKNRALVWLPYAAAAAILLLVVSVWLLQYPGNGSLNNTELATRGKIEQKQRQQKPFALQPAIPAEDTATPAPELNAIDAQIALQEEAGNKQVRDSKEIKAEKQNRPVSIENKKPATSSTANEGSPNPATKPAITPLENTLAQIEPEKKPSVVSPSSLTKDQSMTIVVTVNLNEEETEKLSGESEEEILADEGEQAKKKTKAGKIFSTLKKIKKGDFDELGIRTETIVAYVKDKASSNTHSNEK